MMVDAPYSFSNLGRALTTSPLTVNYVSVFEPLIVSVVMHVGRLVAAKLSATDSRMKVP